MRRKDKLVTDNKQLHEVIHKAEVGRLAMADGNEPYVIPLSFGFDGTHLYFHAAREGRKVDILKRNNLVCVEFEENVKLLKSVNKVCDWSVQYFSVLCHGKAELIEDLEEKRYGLNQVVKQYSPDFSFHPFTERELSSVLVYKILIDRMVGKKSTE